MLWYRAPFLHDAIMPWVHSTEQAEAPCQPPFFLLLPLPFLSVR